MSQTHGFAAAARIAVPESASTGISDRFISGAACRRAADLRSLESARAEARAAAEDLLQALSSDLAPGDLAARTRRALSIVGKLWESAARVAE